MSQPVKLSNELIDDARKIAEITHRSLAAQIGFWAALGRAIEPVLRGDRSAALIKSGKAEPLSECIGRVETAEGQFLLNSYLEKQPYPHYHPVPEQPGYFYRIEQDGTKTKGRFVQREFRTE